LAITCPRCQKENQDNTRFCGSCGTKLHPTEQVPVTLTQTIEGRWGELVSGNIFAGRYFIIEELGRGGMGRVYRAVDKKLDVEIAVKLIKPEIASDPKTIERFKNELKLARMISHKNVCRMFDMSEDQGSHFITMEYIPGEDLKSTLRRAGSLNLERAVTIAKQICDGLAAAHHLDIIHRDLKPQNIIVDKNGNVRIMDFGISRSTQARGITAEGIMIGTPEYISPEQAEAGKVDARSDIYSFGIMLFEMVTGKVPFEGDTTLSIIMKQKLELPPDPRKITPHLPKEISRIILKCLEKDKERRYKNVEALHADLEKFEKEILLKATAGTKEKAALADAGRSRRPLMIAGTATAAVAVLVVGYLILGMGAKNKGGTRESGAGVAKTDVLANKNEAMPLVSPSKSLEIKTSQPTTTNPPVQKPDAAVVAIGHLEIKTVPIGADIYINDRWQGKSPFSLDLPTGTYDLRIARSPEYLEHKESLTLKTGDSIARNVPLTPQYILDVKTTPEAADLFIDGAFRGKTPQRSILVKNSAQIELKKDEDYGAITETLSLKPGVNVIQRTLKKTTCLLTIRTNPAGASIFIGNTNAGASPITNRSVAPGTYTIRMEKEGYRPLQETLDVENDITKTYELAKLQTGQLRLNINPYADVYINDRLVGEVPPLRTQELQEGKYTVKCISSGLNKTVTVPIEIVGGDSKELRVNMVTGESKVISQK